MNASADESWIEHPIINRFLRAAEHFSEKIAVDDGDRSLTYSELVRASGDLARRIDLMVPAGQPIGILLPNNALFPVASLACLAVGRVYVPIDLHYPVERNEQITQDAGLGAIVFDGSQRSAQIAEAEIRYLEISESLTAPSSSYPVAAAPADAPAVVLYTSGSTGRPKGICNNQIAISHRVMQFTQSCEITADDRILLLTSPGTIAGTRDTFTALLNGATLTIADPRCVGIAGILRALQDNRITIFYAVPALLREIFRAQDAKQACEWMRVIRVGGDIVLESDITLCRAMLPQTCRILIAYSSTEATTVFQWFVPPDWTADSHRVPSGYQMPVGQVTTIKEDGTPAAVGEVAELVVESRFIALGAWQQGRLQADTFQTCPTDRSIRILHTGDLIRRRDDGLVELIGRTDRQVKVRGLRVDLSEIESVVRRTAGVSQATVTSQGPDGHAVLVAYVVPALSDANALRQHLKQVLAEELPAHMRPAQMHFVELIPHLPNFKPDIEALKKLQNKIGEDAPPVAVDSSSITETKDRSRIDAAVEHAWTKVLGHRSFAADRPWNEAGGDSLSALSLWFIIEEALGMRLSLEALSADAKPSDLTEAIEKLFESSKRSAAHDDTIPHVFFLPAFEGDVPVLARFRAAFKDSVRFTVIHYPTWREMINARAGFDLIVNVTVRQVLEACGNEPLMLAGFSFGGFVAWGAARRLVALGKRVEFLGLIDSGRANLLKSDKHFSASIRKVFYKNWWLSKLNAGTVLAPALRALIRISAYQYLMALGTAAMQLPLKAAYSFHTTLIWELRLRSVRTWTPEPLDFPVTLFRSNDGIRTSRDLGWNQLCPQVNVIHIGGSHSEILESPYRERLCERFIEAVNSKISRDSD